MPIVNGKQIKDDSLDLRKLKSSGTKILSNQATLGSNKTVNEITESNEFVTREFVVEKFAPKSNVESVYSSTSGDIAFDLSTSTVFKRTINGNVSDLSFSNGDEGTTYKIYFKIDSIGGYSFEYDYLNVETQNGTAIEIPIIANSKHLLQVEPLDNGKYLIIPIYNLKTPTRNISSTVETDVVTTTGTEITLI